MIDHSSALLAAANDGPISDRRFLIIGAVSLLIVLAWLYRGGWRYLVQLIVGTVVVCIGIAASFALVGAIFLIPAGLAGREDQRAESFLVGIAYAAFLIVFWAVFGNDNAVTRFVKKWHKDDFLDEQ